MRSCKYMATCMVTASIVTYNPQLCGRCQDTLSAQHDLRGLLTSKLSTGLVGTNVQVPFHMDPSQAYCHDRQVRPLQPRIRLEQGQSLWAHTIISRERRAFPPCLSWPCDSHCHCRSITVGGRPAGAAPLMRPRSADAALPADGCGRGGCGPAPLMRPRPAPPVKADPQPHAPPRRQGSRCMT